MSKKEHDLLSTNTGSIGGETAHHNTLKRSINANLDRKNQNFVAKRYTEKKHLHPKITQCISSKNKNGLNITSADAEFIKKEFGTNGIPIFLNQKEPEKALRSTGVYICLSPTSPSGYTLKYKGK